MSKPEKYPHHIEDMIDFLCNRYLDSAKAMKERDRTNFDFCLDRQFKARSELLSRFEKLSDEIDRLRNIEEAARNLLQIADINEGKILMHVSEGTSPNTTDMQEAWSALENALSGKNEDSPSDKIETTFADVPIGSKWVHDNGNEYVVFEYSNVGSKSPKHPPTVIYKNADSGKLFSRPLSDWTRSLSPVPKPEFQLRP